MIIFKIRIFLGVLILKLEQLDVIFKQDDQSTMDKNALFNLQTLKNEACFFNILTH